jgi:hypothetical protein
VTRRLRYRPPGDRDPEARWLLQVAMTRARRTDVTVRAILRATDAPRDLRERAFRVAKADFSEGFCPVHGAPFEIVTEGGTRNAHCAGCGRDWGKPTAWASSEDVA